MHSPRVVSHRAIVLPLGKGAALRQAVVRIQSRQSLVKLDSAVEAEDALVHGRGTEKDVQEYVVLQKRMWNEQEGPWMVWGTTEESNPGEILNR